MAKILYEKNIEDGSESSKEVKNIFDGMVQTILGSKTTEKLDINIKDFYEDEVWDFEVYLVEGKLNIFTNILYDGDVYFEAYEIEHCGELDDVITDGVTQDKYKIIDSIAVQLIR